jgi:hypothetical protein
MPDSKVNVIISGTDDLSPKIDATTSALRKLETEAKSVEIAFREVGVGLGSFADQATANMMQRRLAELQAMRSSAQMQFPEFQFKELRPQVDAIVNATKSFKQLEFDLDSMQRAADKAAAYEERLTKAINDGTKAMEQNAKAAQQRNEAMAAGGKGGGMGGAAKGEEEGEFSKEFISGVNYMIGAWSIGFTLAQMVIEKITDAFQQAAYMSDFFTQELAKSGATASSVAGDYGDLMNIVYETGHKFEEVHKRREALRAEGMSKAEANQDAQFQLDYLNKYGDELKDVDAKARHFKASVEDILKIAKEGTPFERLRAPALEYRAEEDRKPFIQFQIQEQQQAEQRLFQDKTHNAQHLFQMQKTQISELMQDRQRAESRAMEDVTRTTSYVLEDKHRAISQEMEDRQRAQSQELEDQQRMEQQIEENTDRAINREMQHRHIAIEQEMQDRHRLAQQREQDEDIAHSRAVGHASAIGGLAESVLLGTPLKGKSGTNLLGAIPSDYITTLKSQMEAGTKAMGLSMPQARFLAREGVLSPQSLVQAGEEQRQDERKAAARQREKEDIQTNHKLQKEAMDERERQEDRIIDLQRRHVAERIGMERQFQLERTQTERQLALEQETIQRELQAEQLELERSHQDEQVEVQRIIAHAEMEYAEAVYQAQIDMARKYEDARLEMERDTLLGLLKLNLEYLKIRDQMKGGTVAKGGEEAGKNGEAADQAQSSYDQLAKSMQDIVDEGEKQNKSTSDLSGSTKDLDDKIKSITDKYQDLIDKEHKKTDATDAHVKKVQELIDKLKELDKEYQNQLQQQAQAPQTAGQGGGGGTTAAGGGGTAKEDLTGKAHWEDGKFYPAWRSKEGMPTGAYYPESGRDAGSGEGNYYDRFSKLFEQKYITNAPKTPFYQEQARSMEDEANRMAKAAGEKAMLGKPLTGEHGANVLTPEYQKAFDQAQKQYWTPERMNAWKWLTGTGGEGSGSFQTAGGPIQEGWDPIRAHYAPGETPATRIGLPAPGQKPQAAEKPEDKAKGGEGATEGTLQKVQQSLEKVFTGGGG